MTWSPHVTVAAIIEHDSKFLFVEEQTRSGIKLNQPAGHLEANETLIDAVIRETQEETAHSVEPQYLVGIYRWYCESKDCTYLRFCFYTKIISFDATQKLDTGIIQTLWKTQNEILSAPDKCRTPLVIQCLSDYLAGRRYPLELLHDQLDNE